MKFVIGLALGFAVMLAVVGFQSRDKGGLRALLDPDIIIVGPQSPVRVVGGSITFRAVKWDQVQGQPSAYTTSPADTSQIHFEDLEPASSTSPKYFPSPGYTAPIVPWRIRVFGHGKDPDNTASNEGVEISADQVNTIMITLIGSNGSKFYSKPAIPIVRS